jgi:hypothetical protein
MIFLEKKFDSKFVNRVTREMIMQWFSQCKRNGCNKDTKKSIIISLKEKDQEQDGSGRHQEERRKPAKEGRL